jgi:hypothetical protein
MVFVENLSAGIGDCNFKGFIEWNKATSFLVFYFNQMTTAFDYEVELRNIFQSHVRFPFNCISLQQCFRKAFLEGMCLMSRFDPC